MSHIQDGKALLASHRRRDSEYQNLVTHYPFLVFESFQHIVEDTNNVIIGIGNHREEVLHIREHELSFVQ